MERELGGYILVPKQQYEKPYDETYLNASVLPSLQKKDAAKLLNMTIQPNWLVYFGAELVAQGGESLVEWERKKQRLFLERMTVQKSRLVAYLYARTLIQEGDCIPMKNPGQMRARAKTDIWLDEIICECRRWLTYCTCHL